MRNRVMDGLETRFGGRTVRTSPLRSPPFKLFGLFSQFHGLLRSLALNLRNGKKQ